MLIFEGEKNMEGMLVLRRFEEIDIKDQFFDSLKKDYSEFNEWFLKKKSKDAYVHYDKNNELQGFLYLKVEDEPLVDIEPKLEFERVLKIGTFKINPHGTRLGERFIKKAIDYAISEEVEACYVTIFEKHDYLIDMLSRYGFEKHGIKKSQNGEEIVLVKDFSKLVGHPLKDYPMLDLNIGKFYLLAIRSDYHSKMFPDSILTTENISMLEDVSYTNSIHKNYVTKMKGTDGLNPGDKLIIYRMAESDEIKKYKSVATSVCQVRKTHHTNQFNDFEHFFQHANAYSIFTEEELKPWYTKGSILIKMTYNAALQRRLNREMLINKIGIDKDRYAGFMELTKEQFIKICEEGDLCEGIIVD
jgi:hypothetical protein